MTKLFWFLFFFAGVGTTWCMVYLGFTEEQVPNTKLWAFAFTLLAFCVMSGFTACMFSNNAF